MTKEYSLFVSYNEADAGWVEKNLLEALDAAEVAYLDEAGFRLGVPRVVEFERAVRNSERTLLVLSPAYLDDNFSQYLDVLVSSYGAETGSWPVIPMIIKPVVDLPTRLSQLVALDATDPERWERALERLFETLGEPVPEPWGKYPGEPPFKGLRYFDVGDAGLFFGREKLAAELVERIAPASGKGDSFLAVVGASGSGKSSLVRAGMVPALLEANEGWRRLIITPTAQPLKELAVALTGDLESVTAATTLMDDLAHDPRSLDIAVARFLKRQGATHGKRASHLLLVVDQFEELFTACKDPGTRTAFIDNLLYAAGSASPENGGGRLTLILALRADFYHHPAQHEGLRAALETHQAYIGSMSPQELRRAIEEPARQNGWTFEPGLVDLMLREVGNEPGGLPLLSHALLETWRRREGRTLTLAGYHEAGGVGGAIARTADRVYGNLSPEQQAIARDIFLRLTELGEGAQDTRRRARLDELLPNDDRKTEAEKVLQTLADARLVTVEKDAAEVAHEALIREWPTLREWLEENREGLRTHRHLTEAANEWERMGRAPSELYRGARLASALEWAESERPALNDLERAFLEASREEEKRQEAEREAARQRELAQAQKLAEEQRRSAQAQRQRAIFLTAGLVVAVLLSILSFSLFQQSNRNLSDARQANTQSALSVAQANIANTQSAQNAATAEARRIQAEDAQATAIVDRDVAATAQTEADSQRQQAEEQALIAQAGELSAQALFQLGQGQDDLAMLLGMEAFLAVDSLQTRQALYTLWKHNPQLLHILQGHTAPVRSVAFSPDGGTLASGSDDNTIRLWDAKTGGALGEPLTGHSDNVNSVAFSPDGGNLASGSDDNTIRLWDAKPKLWVAYTCQRVGRNLTEAEWNRYLSWKGPFDPEYKTCPQWPSAGELQY